ncbi:aldo/keto reductase [Paenibacillus thalictri]|uniref:Aldo/keto reductase n=1 Tax=Paenibacillus thalictri TaxID=2527873 RepID=A0A4V2J4Y3_9BACL|nr:aldo/keto reductase [Paenibacillus thalictri]TBL81132.1 aldo/keto reductase [Paenibacillus thalictri]
MKKIALERRGITSSRLLFGCMKFCGGMQANPITEEEILKTERAVDAALSIGITMFDHADIYAHGQAEAVFGEVLKRRPQLRDQIVIQSKCGYRMEPGTTKRYDFSREHILNAVDRSLKRLGVERLDILLLHRPDPLMEPEEIAEAFDKLLSAGKVSHFGVSNVGSDQIKYIQSALPVPLIVNQLDMSLGRLDWVDHGILMNRKVDKVIRFPEGTLEHCRTENIQLQAWGSLAQGRFTGRVMEQMTEAEQLTAELVRNMANEKETTPESIVLGWLMKHPAMVQPVIGTVNPERIAACGDAARQSELMTREEWYLLYKTSRGQDIP